LANDLKFTPTKGACWLSEIAQLSTLGFELLEQAQLFLIRE
jgi:hypothetical protein